jgi:hypothetical protein
VVQLVQEVLVDPVVRVVPVFRVAPLVQVDPDDLQQAQHDVPVIIYLLFFNLFYLQDPECHDDHPILSVQRVLSVPVPLWVPQRP